ncbi:hypothetical protein OIE63_39340 (plasmid) [Streptomyces sp. NBC_01795]|uniref:hypothetical protein n=1 Tax=unclassified Streptomyces TaxID=2593676 RepID=UPI002DDAFFCD|nr:MULTISPECIES: hypothetical protein [unclassified Streptomyces]WSA97580.1 hypothetical protein OIE63_39340 [Streptomyces sp. NBC_01795]WSB82172.1 hypothetical protein OHB04_41475 [Streptomyces sp. NBC_01775]WSS18143.1 hypothetical protein OG533_40555 [Streptomyces sp. NBC_01186]
MPTPFQQLSAHRELSALRTVLKCSGKTTALREGPADEPGQNAAWLAFLCPAHSESLPEWPGARTHPDSDSLPCGTVLDFRATEQLLQSHADLWLTPLTGVRPDASRGAWPDFLDQAGRVLRDRLEQDDGADEDGPLQSIVMMMGMARRSAASDDLHQATISLGYCETLTQSL